MVVPSAQRLAQLEAIVIADSGHPLQHADPFEDDEVAVQRALRDVGPVGGEEVGDRNGSPCRGHEVEDRSTLLRVALSDAAESAFSSGVELGTLR
jgi:hypothetical protein